MLKTFKFNLDWDWDRGYQSCSYISERAEPNIGVSRWYSRVVYPLSTHDHFIPWALLEIVILPPGSCFWGVFFRVLGTIFLSIGEYFPSISDSSTKLNLFFGLTGIFRVFQGFFLNVVYFSQCHRFYGLSSDIFWILSIFTDFATKMK